MSGRTPLVLMYHGIGEVPAASDPDNLYVPEAAFAAQLDHLAARGWTVLDEAGYLAALDGAPTPRRSVLVTFDDGYVSVLERAAPQLARRGMSAICYVSPGLDGQAPLPGMPPESRLMTAAQMRELSAAGVALGCHGWAHESMPGMSTEQLEQCTVRARDELHSLVGERVATFAYPFGHHDAAAREAVAAAGFACALATYDGAGRLAIPRVDVNATDTARTFELKLSRVYPLARRALGSAPAVRRAAHRVLGHAARS
ncbi:polysaccharide deacetylase family protein [Janibacter sp. UYMM211]|uniref:polysaccharide deacetylase family protein n=1 Tax=Janibacter sp. UYMM211 TaxID=3156342 RepID=UPI00339B48E6